MKVKYFNKSHVVTWSVFPEMTEEEMMDLALRLSEQEASNTARRLQREEEAMMKAIEESVSTNLSQ